MDAHPAFRVQQSTDGGLEGQGQVAVAGGEAVSEIEAGEPGGNVPLRLVAALFHQGAAAGVRMTARAMSRTWADRTMASNFVPRVQASRTA